MTKNSILLEKTPDSWAHGVLKNFDLFLLDHAACERKAAFLALSFTVKYPEREALIDPMISLAIEELKHLKEVNKIILDRKIPLLQKDEKDTYVNKFIASLRHGRNERLLDRLLMSSLVEARGEERFSLITEHLEDPFFKEFYTRLAHEEAGHHRLFMMLARHYFSDEEISARLKELAVVEAEAMLTTPLSYRLH